MLIYSNYMCKYLSMVTNWSEYANVETILHFRYKEVGKNFWTAGTPRCVETVTRSVDPQMIATVLALLNYFEVK